AEGDGPARARRPVQRRGGGGGGPGDVRARRDRLGRRGAAGGRGAGGGLAPRHDRHGSEPPPRPPPGGGDENLRPPHRVAELDLPAAERGGRQGRAAGLRAAGTAGVRLETDMTISGNWVIW